MVFIISIHDSFLCTKRFYFIEFQTYISSKIFMGCPNSFFFFLQTENPFNIPCSMGFHGDLSSFPTEFSISMYGTLSSVYDSHFHRFNLNVFTIFQYVRSRVCVEISAAFLCDGKFVRFEIHSRSIDVSNGIETE